jgi:NADH-quinone oxidoreductase subunit J
MMPSVLQLVFLFFAAVTVVGALAVVLVRNLFHAALWLAVTFLSVASLFIVLNADFVGLSQVIVYVGAISVLMLFAIMLTEDVVGARGLSLRSAWPAALPVAAGVCVVLVRWFARYAWLPPQPPKPGGTAGTIGLAFIQKYLFAFELASVILLAALIGAIYLAKEERS